MGQRQLSLKGESPTWRGITRLSATDRGERFFTKLENCYISRDGGEIRQFPGYATFLDLTDINNDQGFSQYQIDTLRPYALPTGPSPLGFGSPTSPAWRGGNYRFENEPVAGDLSKQQIHYSRCKPAHVWAFEQINNEIVLIGESRFREDPIYPPTYSSPNAPLTVINAAIDTSGRFLFQLSDSVGGTGLENADVRPINVIKVGDSVYADSVTVEDSDFQQELDAKVNGHVHLVSNLSGDILTLNTTSTIGLKSEAATGEAHRVRYARKGVSSYVPQSPSTPYMANYLRRPDDPDALTAWRVRVPIDLYDSTTQNTYACARSEVCNRQRDWGDNDTGGADTSSPFGTLTRAEGIVISGTPTVVPSVDYHIGLSRREQRKLPYRPHIECATDRIVLAAPQYGCMFQIPMKAPVVPEYYSSPNDSGYGGVGALANDIYDRPRSLGIPKPRLVDSSYTSPSTKFLYTDYTSSTTPSIAGASSNEAVFSTPTANSFFTTGVSGSPDVAMTNGTYKVAISFEDPGTGEEGLASETMEVTLSGAKNSTIWINYIHPGYHFPEAAAWKLNVYLAQPSQEALAFYGQYDLQRFPRIQYDGGSETSYYGLQPQLGTSSDALTCRFALPVPLDSSPTLAEQLNPTRLAPQSASMPRGASVCKMIRGTLFAGGALGNAGPDLQLWRSKATARHKAGDRVNSPNNQLWIRTHNWYEASFGYDPSRSTDGTVEDTTLGIAGRAFPDAYQGVPFINNTGMFPGRDSYKFVDKVLNRMSIGEREFSSPGYPAWRHLDRLKLRREAFDRQLAPGSDSSGTPNWNRQSQSVYYLMPRGQLQIGDPGAPYRSSRAFIKIVDANKGDDITAIGQVGGSAIVCTRKETYSYSWYVAPGSSQPNLMSNEFGCIASNSMVEFDGGLAWLSERGPVAMGAGLQYIGVHVGEDFYNNERRYIRDSRGMMRHSWGAHDAARGLIMWGLITREATHTITDEGATYTPLEALSVNTAALNKPDDYGDQVLSRFPCDEILIWNYTVNAFSTWRPPAGLEVYWMRPIRDANGAVRMAFLAADQRIYVLNDEWGDANGVFVSGMVATAASAGTASQTLTLNTPGYQDGDTLDGEAQGRNWNMLYKPGLLIEFLDSIGNIVAETTVDSVVTTNPTGPSTSTSTVQLSSAQTWTEGQRIRVGARQRATIISNYMGSGAGKMSVEAVSMRYRLFPSDKSDAPAEDNPKSSNVKVTAYKSDDGTLMGSDARVVLFTPENQWEAIGYMRPDKTLPSEIDQLGRRKTFAQGRLDAEEVAIKVELTGERQVRIKDLLLELDP